MNPAFNENGKMLTLEKHSGKKSKPPTRPPEGTFTAQILDLLESESQGMKQKQIAQVLGIRRQSVTSALKNLRVRRLVYGVADGRSGKRYYALTSE